MRAARVFAALPVALLFAAPLAKAQAGDPPTLFERWQERKAKNPAL